VDSIFQLLRFMQKLGSPISNLISRTSIFGSTTSSINAKSRYPVFQKPHDEIIKTKRFFNQIKWPLVKLTMRPNDKRLNNPRPNVRSNATQRHIVIDTRAPPKKMKYTQKCNERIKNVLNSRLENPKNKTLEYFARNLTLD
jgi:hypothetical protein